VVQVKAFVFAILIIFFLLILLFDSYTQPLLVLSAIPFSVIGVIDSGSRHSHGVIDSGSRHALGAIDSGSRHSLGAIDSGSRR
jgi:hypothetical protein